MNGLNSLEHARELMCRLGPVRAAFLGSLLLSFVALAGGDGPNRDGILYLDAAQAYLDGGWESARALFNWPLMSVLIALLSRASGLTLESTAFALCVLLLAGTCALLVDLTRQRAPEAGWAMCLAVLAMPGFNAYRTDIFREFGFWFFVILAVVLAQSWTKRPRWREALGGLIALGAAAAFRLEALAFAPVLLLWQWIALGERRRRVHAIMLFLVPAVGAAAAVIAVVMAGGGPGERLAGYLAAIDPATKLALLQDAAQRLSDTVLMNKYAADEATSILLFGLMSTIVVKFVAALGVFVLPLGVVLAKDGVGATFRRWQPQSWMGAVYVVALVAFLTQNFFMVARYVVLLNLLVLPVAAVGMVRIAKRWPRWKPAGIAVLVVIALANVISLSPGKTQYRAAGEWLHTHVENRERVFLEDGRPGYFAGWSGRPTLGFDRATALTSGRFDYLVLDVRKRGAEVRDLLQPSGWRVVASFRNKGGDEVLIAGRGP